MASLSKVMIHGSEWNLADIAEAIADCRKRPWRLQAWRPRDALVQNTTDTVLPYVGQQYDPAEFKLVRGAWKRDHCEICYWELFESPDQSHSTGYANGQRWICAECHERFIAVEDKQK
jgi:hypothetical protein